MSQLTYSAEPAFTDVLNSSLAQDQPVTQSLIQAIHHNALWSAVRCEWFDMGWYADGDTIPNPVSPVDAHAYSSAETLFIPMLGSSRQPDARFFKPGQFNFPILANADLGSGRLVLAPYVLKIVGGVLTCQMYFGVSGIAHQGSVRVMAAGQRLLGTLSFADGSPVFQDSVNGVLLEKLLLGGNPLTQSVLRAISNNAKFGAVRMEVFDAGYYADGNTITLPTGVGPYSYSQSECIFVPILASVRQPDPAFFTPGQPSFPTLAGADAGSGDILEMPYQLKIDWTSGKLISKMYFAGSGSTGQGTVHLFIIAQRQSAQVQG